LGERSVLFLILIITIGCSNKGYRITTYNYFKLPSASFGTYLVSGNYGAKKIISYDSTSIRFIDLNGNEQFISSDKIEVEKIK